MHKTSGLILLISLLFSFCNTDNKKFLFASDKGKMIDTASGSCPYLTKDDKGNVVLSWITQADTTTYKFCYAVSQDEGKTFSSAIEIPGSSNVNPHGENMPKILFKPSGEIIAAWGAANPNPANAYSGLVYYSRSVDKGKTWTKPISITKDTASFDQRYFDLALLPNGEAGIVWLDNRKTSAKEGSGLYYAVTNGKDGFQNEKLIAEPCCQCCRTDLFVDTKKNIHVLYRAIISDSIRDMVHVASVNGGETFSKPERISKDNWAISGCPHTGPAMTENSKGLHFTWFTGGNGAGIYFNTSTDNGKTFSARDSVSGKAAKHCQITTLPNDHILITWNEGFENEGKFSSRIGLEERDINGQTIIKDYITTTKSNSSFPVICPINAHKAVIAYTENVNDRNYVWLKQISAQ